MFFVKMMLPVCLVVVHLRAGDSSPTIVGDGIVEFSLVKGKNKDTFCALPNTDGTEIPPSSASKLTEENYLSRDQCEEKCKAQGPEGCFAYAVSEWNCRLYTQAVSTEVAATKPGWTGCYARVVFCPPSECIKCENSRWKYKDIEYTGCANPDSDDEGPWVPKPEGLDELNYKIGSGKYHRCATCIDNQNAELPPETILQ